MTRLQGKSVMVTGASNGIGRALALAFARAGATPIIATDIDPAGLEALSLEIEAEGARAYSYIMDVSDQSEVEDVIAQIAGRFVTIDVLANVAGIGILGPVEKLKRSDWDRIINVNLLGTINTTRSVYPRMTERGSGHIVNVSSARGLFVPALYSAPYMASKFGVVGLCRALALEGMARGIRVTCICPGAVRTQSRSRAIVRGMSPAAFERGKLVKYLAQEPEETAGRIVEAVRRDDFLVITSPYMKLAYFLRRHLQLAWFLAARPLARWKSRLSKKHETKEPSGNAGPARKQPK